MGRTRIFSIAAVGISLLLPVVARASVSLSYQFNGKGNWSLDAMGNNNSGGGTVSADVPLGSTVEQAFLYSSKTFGNTGLPTVTFDGTVLGAGAWTALGVVNNLQAYRADVTAQVAAKIGGGSNSLFSFAILEGSQNSVTDGEVLAIVYSNPAEVERTIAFLDGNSSQSGDLASFAFANPLGDPTAAGFEALYSLGIGFGFQSSSVTNQRSIVDGNGRRLTSSAGGQDDGGPFNGGLITVGGLGDSPANPHPFILPSGPRTDDELYDLAQGNVVDPTPFLSAGDTSFTVTTSNPSFDDNVFFMGINVTAKGNVTEGPAPDPAVIPEPTTLVIWSLLATLGLGFFGRRRRRN